MDALGPANRIQKRFAPERGCGTRREASRNERCERAARPVAPGPGDAPQPAVRRRPRPTASTSVALGPGQVSALDENRSQTAATDQRLRTRRAPPPPYSRAARAATSASSVFTVTSAARGRSSARSASTRLVREQARGRLASAAWGYRGPQEWHRESARGSTPPPARSLALPSAPTLIARTRWCASTSSTCAVSSLRRGTGPHLPQPRGRLHGDQRHGRAPERARGRERAHASASTPCALPPGSSPPMASAIARGELPGNDSPRWSSFRIDSGRELCRAPATLA